MKKINQILLFTGVSLLMFGVLKFVNPFKAWYAEQILKSGLGTFSYWMGITSEIFTGILCLTAYVYCTTLSKRQHSGIVILTSSLVIIMMLTAVYVHLKPEVPASILPLKIKTPIIPFIFLALAVTNIYLLRKSKNYCHGI